ncbi:TIM barrel protein [Candidatus Pacearchaeota archaeon]|nr:TIM barrel protein [Candidatus Pacearchaeota archaeon]
MNFNKIKFGASGNPLNFFKSEFGKDRLGVIEWSAKLGLNAQERQMTYGARMKEDDAIEFGKRARKFGVSLSIHGPYYVVLNSKKEKVIENSIKELIKTTRLADLMGAKKVVFHPGFGRDIKKIIEGLKEVEKEKPKSVVICPETTGKISQSGDLNEVLEICENTECEPCIDFAHLHARGQGSLMEEDDFRKVLVEIEKRLGKKSLKDLHCHFYPIEFTEKGERVHRAVTEENVFPRFESFANLIKEFKMAPTLISESKNTQDIGALEMKRTMEELR